MPLYIKQLQIFVPYLKLHTKLPHFHGNQIFDWQSMYTHAETRQYRQQKNCNTYTKLYRVIHSNYFSKHVHKEIITEYWKYAQVAFPAYFESSDTFN